MQLGYYFTCSRHKMLTLCFSCRKNEGTKTRPKRPDSLIISYNNHYTFLPASSKVSENISVGGTLGLIFFTAVAIDL